MKFALSALLLTISSVSFATGPAYKGTAVDKNNLLNAVPGATCRHIINVRTGGTLGSALGAICEIDGKEKLVCLNQMVGNVESKDLTASPLTVEAQIISLIEESCTGG